MPAPIIIQPAVETSLAAIKAFDVFSGSRKDEIARGEVLIALVEGQVAGYLTHNRNFYGRPFVAFVCVHSNYRRLGIADLLYKAMEALYPTDKLIFSSTEADNDPMLSFFKKHGWEESGAIKNIQACDEVVFVKRRQ